MQIYMMICHHPIEGAELGACLANLSSKVPLRISKNERFCSPPFLEQLFSRPESRVIGLDWTVWTDEELSMIFAHAPKHLTRVAILQPEACTDGIDCPKEITRFLKKQVHLRVFHSDELDFRDWNSSDVNELFAGFATHAALEHLDFKCSFGRKSFTGILAFFKEMSIRKGGRLHSISFYCLVERGEEDPWNWSQLLPLISLTADRLTSFSIELNHWSDATPNISDSLWSKMVRSLSSNSSITELHLGLERGEGFGRCFKDKGLNEMICRNRGEALHNDLRRIPKNLWSHRIKKHLASIETFRRNEQVRPFDSLFSSLTKGLNKELCEKRPRKRQHGNHSTEIQVGKNE